MWAVEFRRCCRRHRRDFRLVSPSPAPEWLCCLRNFSPVAKRRERLDNQSWWFHRRTVVHSGWWPHTCQAPISVNHLVRGILSQPREKKRFQKQNKTFHSYFEFQHVHRHWWVDLKWNRTLVCVSIFDIEISPKVKWLEEAGKKRHHCLHNRWSCTVFDGGKLSRQLTIGPFDCKLFG